MFWSLIVNISACICIRLSLSRHSHFVFLQKLRMKFHMYINFRTHQTVARSWRELKMFVFWEHWFGIASIMAWRLVRVLKVFKGNHRKFSVIGSQDKWIKMRFVFVLSHSPFNKECPVVASIHKCKIGLSITTLASRVWYFAAEQKICLCLFTTASCDQVKRLGVKVLSEHSHPITSANVTDF